ncbi:PepSY domain-containing protein [Novosphingobium lentum]|uniref:PepSY domain-containing protein n=1 Tax=Novosphingobium lentum TaxID=145287 RepID=UPI00082A3AC8|nr:PepSY domain-containing protein [Novosphingobium lentum]
MRKWHRWLVVFFGVFLLWIAGTGVAMQAIDLFKGDDDHDKPAAAQRGPGAAAVTLAVGTAEMPPPADAPRKPKKADLRHTIQHMHSGEWFGPFGVLVNTLSGLALLFFSFSGLWMYIQMWRNRAHRNIKPGWFWK